MKKLTLLLPLVCLLAGSPTASSTTTDPPQKPDLLNDAVDAYRTWLLLDGLTGPVRGQAEVTFSKAGKKNVCTIKEKGVVTRRLGDSAQDAFRAAITAAYHLDR